MDFHWCLSDTKLPVFWPISTCPLISKSSSLFPKTSGIVLSTPIGITIIRFHSLFFSSLARSNYLSHFLLSFIFTRWYVGMAKSTIQQVFFILLTITRSGLLAGINGVVYISKSQRILCISFSRTDSGLCI